MVGEEAICPACVDSRALHVGTELYRSAMMPNRVQASFSRFKVNISFL